MSLTAWQLAAGALYAWGVLLTPAVGAVLMSASTVIVAINAMVAEDYEMTRLSKSGNKNVR